MGAWQEQTGRAVQHAGGAYDVCEVSEARTQEGTRGSATGQCLGRDSPHVPVSVWDSSPAAQAASAAQAIHSRDSMQSAALQNLRCPRLLLWLHAVQAAAARREPTGPPLLSQSRRTRPPHGPRDQRRVRTETRRRRTPAASRVIVRKCEAADLHSFTVAYKYVCLQLFATFYNTSNSSLVAGRVKTAGAVKRGERQRWLVSDARRGWTWTVDGRCHCASATRCSRKRRGAAGLLCQFALFLY